MAQTQTTAGDAAYTVVARRYRPQRFEDVVGQDHVVQSLRNAIRLNKVTHAYLFSGTRGVGKTSIARIFAKCLNCVEGPTESPCQVCDICRAIAVGQDVDVIEIDGASNNGVEAVRELRQNAGLRPSRARFKIYYIDEVHMLSTGAFNALLKTLEEPPGHVKFFFATTEPNKIPITVLSRCQRHEFAGIKPEEIAAALIEICSKENVETEPDALRAVARRASGSMRDAQSLLEQLLASGETRLSVERVHQLLGTAPDDRVLDLLDALADHDLARTLTLLDAAVDSGVQAAEMLGGVIEFLRDAMVLHAGADVGLLAAGPSARPRLEALIARWPLDSVLAAQQILAETRGRMRGSPHGRQLVELALARVARLDDLAELGELIGRLSALESGAPAPAVKKKPPSVEPVTPGVAAAGTAAPRLEEKSGRDGRHHTEIEGRSEPPTFSLEAIRERWSEVVESVGEGIGAHLKRLQPMVLDGPNVLVIAAPAGYNWSADACEKPEARDRIEATLRSTFGRPVRLRFERPESAPTSPTPTAPRAEIDGDPFVRKLVELFDAKLAAVELEPEMTDDR